MQPHEGHDVTSLLEAWRGQTLQARVLVSEACLCLIDAKRANGHDRSYSLAAFYSRQSDVVELKFFGDLTAKQIAEVSRVSRQVVLRGWKPARSWRLREMKQA